MPTDNPTNMIKQLLQILKDNPTNNINRQSYKYQQKILQISTNNHININKQSYKYQQTISQTSTDNHTIINKQFFKYQQAILQISTDNPQILLWTILQMSTDSSTNINKQFYAYQKKILQTSTDNFTNDSVGFHSNICTYKQYISYYCSDFDQCSKILGALIFCGPKFFSGLNFFEPKYFYLLTWLFVFFRIETPMGFQNSIIELGTSASNIDKDPYKLSVASEPSVPPPPYHGHCPKFFRLVIMMAPLRGPIE